MLPPVVPVVEPPVPVPVPVPVVPPVPDVPVVPPVPPEARVVNDIAVVAVFVPPEFVTRALYQYVVLGVRPVKVMLSPLLPAGMFSVALYAPMNWLLFA